jgi:hypothetical protein
VFCSAAMEEQNDLLSSMERKITQKLEDFEQTRRAFTQEQITRLQPSVQKQDSFTFRKKGNEKQHKVNARVLDKMKPYRLLSKESLKVLTF